MYIEQRRLNIRNLPLYQSVYRSKCVDLASAWGSVNLFNFLTKLLFKEKKKEIAKYPHDPVFQ